MKSEIAKLKKGNVEYTLRGEGPAVLNLYGGHSNCQESFGTQPLLDAGYSVLTPSRPGYGKTNIEAKTAVKNAVVLIELLDYKVGKIIFKPKFQKITWFMLRKIANNFPKFFAKIFLPQFSTLSKK